MRSLTRRTFVKGTLSVALAAAGRDLFGKAAQPATPVNFEIPPDACDCHTHIYDPGRFPFSPTRNYTPETALSDEMAALHRALHIRRVVIVTPSPYGTDNAATVYGLRARGNDARGIAVIDEKTPDTDLDAMHRAGVRGIRLNFAVTGVADPNVARARLSAAADRLQRRGWHLQLYAELALIAALKATLLTLPVPVVIDHFGMAQAELGPQQPGFPELLELVSSGKAYVKISGAYRISKLGPDFPDVAPLARALIAANPDRILWGSDWPHPLGGAVAAKLVAEGKKNTDTIVPHLAIDDGRLLNQLPIWTPSAPTRKRILVDNPARVYQF